MWSRSTCTDRPARRGAWLALLLALVPPVSDAGPVQKLLMPGPLVQGHAKLEDDCSNCHESFSRKDQAQKCRACHEAIDQDIKAKKGFHGRSSAVASQDCHGCHSDHKGRDADIVGLKPALFDHKLTDFPLGGAHAVLGCDSCHAKGKPLRAAQAACASCHKKDDVHKGQMGASCQSCHSTESWRKSAFDHDKTKFPLRDKHRDAPCASCHIDGKYKGTTTSCAGCHQMQDPHGGLFGAACQDCHGAKAWTLARFDHARTEFPLQGRHATVACHACHTAQTRNTKLPEDCNGCHRASDIHQGRFGTQCATCHSAEGWTKKSFDHDKDTGFPLRGAHRAATCDNCHATVPQRKAARAPVRACVECHRKDDPHRGQQGERCGSCHDDSSWLARVKFDHDLTRFPLLGLHALVDCRECHQGGTYKSTPIACASCHAKKDPHNGALGPRCESCHTTAGWPAASFDHARTKFPLDGAHAKRRCADCHRKAVRSTTEAVIDGACNSCHASDDVHGGGFGTDCQRCHTTTSFSNARIQRKPPGAR